MSKKRSHLLSSSTTAQSTNYTKNVPNIFLQNDGTSDFQFKVQAFFTGPIVYKPESIESVALYGGNAWGRSSGGHGWDQSMWPGQFARQGNTDPGWTSGCKSQQSGIGAGQYLVKCNPSCNSIEKQPQCKYSSTNAITTDPDLSKNTCCVPYFDINENVIKKGKEVIFNSYYGFCFSGYGDNWDFCTNKQIWISATPDYLSTTKLGSTGYADPLDTVNGKTIIAQSTNTKDISFFSGSGVSGGNAGDWCTGNYCPIPSNNSPVYVNPPQITSSTFPKVINSSTINWTVPGLGVTADAKRGCPVDCPVPNGFIRWGQKLISGNTPPSGSDNPNDWTVALPSDDLGNIVWMPNVNQRQISYYPLIKDSSSKDPNALNPILGTKYDFNSLIGNSSYANATDLALWMGSVASSTSLSMSSRQYVAYGCLIHGVVCAIYNDWYSNDPASGLTILNPVSDFINLYFTHSNVQGTRYNSFKVQLAGDTSTNTPPAIPNGLNVWTNVIGNDKEPVTGFFKPDVTLIANLIKEPEIKLVNGQYQITFSQSIWQFLESSVYNSIISLFKTDTPTNYNTLISTLNNYLNTLIKSYFGSNQGYESMTFNGNTTTNTQPMELQIIGSTMNNIQMSFNCWNMVAGQQQASPILAYNFINPNGTLKGSAFGYKNNNLYHAVSINYTAVIKQFSPMSVLYYAYKTSGKGLNLEITDPMCQYDFDNPTIAPPLTCMNAYVTAKGTPRAKLLDVCNGGIGSGRGGGGFQYQPPIKKITAPTTPPWNTAVFRPIEIQVTVAGDGSIANYLFSQNQGQDVPECACVQSRLKTDILSGDPTGAMCFSAACTDPLVEKNLQLTKQTCANYCKPMCELLQGHKINNTDNFDPATFYDVCGYSCNNWRFNPNGFNQDIVNSSFVLVPLITLSFWLMDSNPISNAKVIKTFFVFLGLIVLFYFAGRLLNGNYNCFEAPGTPKGVTPQACYLNWPFGGKPPPWYNFKIPKSLCKNWWEIPCDCLGSCDPNDATCTGCGKNCECIDMKCTNLDKSKRKTIIKQRPKFNLVYLIAAIVFSICGIFIFNKLSKFSGIMNDIISGLIIVVPLVVWFILFNGTAPYTYTESTCS
jgi:hypothetical protein